MLERRGQRRREIVTREGESEGRDKRRVRAKVEARGEAEQKGMAVRIER